MFSMVFFMLNSITCLHFDAPFLMHFHFFNSFDFFLTKFNYFCAFLHFTFCFSCIPSVNYFCSLKSLTLRSLQTHAVFFLLFISHERFLFHYISCVFHCRLSVDFLNWLFVLHLPRNHCELSSDYWCVVLFLPCSL